MVLFQEPMGALAPVGGEAAGHKGYGLAFMNELLVECYPVVILAGRKHIMKTTLSLMECCQS